MSNNPNRDDDKLLIAMLAFCMVLWVLFVWVVVGGGGE